MGNSVRTWQIDAGGERVDKYLASAMPDYSRSAVQRLIAAGRVHVNGELVKASHILAPDDEIEVDLPPPSQEEIRAEPVALDILHEDDSVIVVNKPAGMVVHPAPGHRTGTLVNALLAHYPPLRKLDEERPGIVHRLDKDTSGVLIVAKDAPTQRYLQAQFKRRQVTKRYLALLLGALEPSHGVIKAPIGRHPTYRQRMAVVSQGGRPAETGYRVLEHLQARDGRREFTLVQVTPKTGRTHQIRVHFDAIGFPVAGDDAYGPRLSVPGLDRQFLHAWKLSLMLPGSEESRSFVAPLADDLRHVLDQLRATTPH
jgi:23S rRNA pseudouridine1911/1915/1917 synthase